MSQRLTSLMPQFTDSIPVVAAMQPGILYISMKYASASHKCACGCGLEVVTPLSRSAWTLHYDGTVSLAPSIGNQEFPCRSHYWIRNDQVQWLPQFTNEQAQAARYGRRPIETPESPAAQRGPFLEFLRRFFGIR